MCVCVLLGWLKPLTTDDEPEGRQSERKLTLVIHLHHHHCKCLLHVVIIWCSSRACTYTFSSYMFGHLYPPHINTCNISRKIQIQVNLQPTNRYCRILSRVGQMMAPPPLPTPHTLDAYTINTIDNFYNIVDRW